MYEVDVHQDHDDNVAAHDVLEYRRYFFHPNDVHAFFDSLTDCAPEHFVVIESEVCLEDDDYLNATPPRWLDGRSWLAANPRS